LRGEGFGVFKNPEGLRFIGQPLRSLETSKVAFAVVLLFRKQDLLKMKNPASEEAG
jgi:hypothetical protein